MGKEQQPNNQNLSKQEVINHSTETRRPDHPGLRSANDAYFHPQFAPYSQRSPQAIAKMVSYGITPRRII